jgi:translation initiation factor IF-2
MKSLNQTLLAVLLGSAMLTACGKQEEPKVETTAPAVAPAPEVKKEPVKEEPGGWVPPPEQRVPGTTIPAEGAAAPAATPEAGAPAPAAEATPAPAAAEKPAK